MVSLGMPKTSAVAKTKPYVHKPAPRQEPVNGMFRFEDFVPVRVTEKGSFYSFPDRWSPDMSEEVYVTDTTVVHKIVHYSTGLSKTGKPWHRWKALETTFYSLKRDKYDTAWLRVYKAMPRKKNFGATFRDISGSYRLPQTGSRLKKEDHLTLFFDGMLHEKDAQYMEIAKMFAVWNLLKKFNTREPELNIRDVQPDNLISFMAYPTMRMFQNNNFEGTANALALNSKIWLTEPDPKLFLRKLLGKEAVRKDFIKALAVAPSAYAISVCNMLKGTVPVDWFLPLIKEPQTYTITNSAVYGGTKPELIIQLKRLLANSTIYQQRRMFTMKTELKDNGQHWFRDAMWMIRDISDEMLVAEFNRIDFTTWKTIHDSVRTIDRDIKMKPQPVPQDGFVAELDGKTYQHEENTYVVRSPKINKELISWGDELNNCIASYSDRVVTKATAVFAVYNHEEKLYANFEVCNGRLVQFVEKHNRHVPADMKNLMVTMIGKAEKTAKAKKKQKITVKA